MRIKKDDGNYFELLASSYKQNILINYKLIKKSNSKFQSIDRGISTDRYSTVLVFSQVTDYVNELNQVLTDLGAASKDIEVDEFEERIFGDNVDHTGVIKCLVEEFGEQGVTSRGVSGVRFNFLATEITYVPETGLPGTFDCIETEWSGFAQWKTTINETINRNNFFVDRVADTYVFKGTYTFTEDDNASLYNYWNTQRGDEFTINDGDFGVPYMFGGVGGNGQHTVVITNVTYSYINHTYRKTTIELVKVA